MYIVYFHSICLEKVCTYEFYYVICVALYCYVIEKLKCRNKTELKQFPHTVMTRS